MAAPEHRPAFHAAFLHSRLGVIAANLPPGVDGMHRVPAGTRLELSRAVTPDGRVWLLTCADRDAFIQRFHARFNAEALGRKLAALALADAECDGILVNSAASFHAVAIDRAELAALLADP